MSGTDYKWAVIPLYFVVWLIALWQIDYQQASLWYWLLVVGLALFNADFYSGLIHIYLDYHPLDKQKGFEKLFHFNGDRNSAEFEQLKRQVMAKTSWLEMTVYSFKVHHRTVRQYVEQPYIYFFYETLPAAAILLALSILLFCLPAHLLLDSLILILLICSIAALHTNHIHACVHGSKTMRTGVRIVKLLQKAGLMYGHKRHNRHHKFGTSGFCLISGHADFLVDRICGWLLQKGWIRLEEWRGEV